MGIIEVLFLMVTVVFTISLFFAIKDNEREISWGKAVLVSVGLFTPVALVIVKFLLKLF